MRQLGRIFTKPKGEERRFFHNHVGGVRQTETDGAAGRRDAETEERV